MRSWRSRRSGECRERRAARGAAAMRCAHKPGRDSYAMSAATGQPPASGARHYHRARASVLEALSVARIREKTQAARRRLGERRNMRYLKVGRTAHVKPKRTANSPRLISSCTCAHPRAKASRRYLVLPVGLAGGELTGGDGGRVAGLVLSTASTFAVMSSGPFAKNTPSPSTRSKPCAFA